MSKGPEASLWQSMRKSLPPTMNPTRIENRHGGGIPDLELQWLTGSAFVELKAPKSTPRLTLQTLQIRPYLFANSAKFWEDAASDGFRLENPIDSIGPDEFSLSVQSAQVASREQKAWHARRFSNGGLSFFLQSTVGRRSKRLLSPIILPEGRELVLGVVVELWVVWWGGGAVVSVGVVVVWLVGAG